jgi:hypothetical protein
MGVLSRHVSICLISYRIERTPLGWMEVLDLLGKSTCMLSSIEFYVGLFYTSEEKYALLSIKAGCQYQRQVSVCGCVEVFNLWKIVIMYHLTIQVP